MGEARVARVVCAHARSPMVRGGVGAMRKGCASHSASQCATVNVAASASKNPRLQLSTARDDAFHSRSHRDGVGR